MLSKPSFTTTTGLRAPTTVPSETAPDIPGYNSFAFLVRGNGSGVALEQVSLKRRVAIKSVLPGFHATDQIVKRIEREAETAAAIISSHVVTIYDVIEHNSSLYLVFEYMDDGDLQWAD